MLEVRSGYRADSALILGEDDIRTQRPELLQVDAVDGQSAGQSIFNLPIDFGAAGIRIDLWLRTSRQRLRFRGKIAFVGSADQTFAQAERINNFGRAGEE